MMASANFISSTPLAGRATARITRASPRSRMTASLPRSSEARTPARASRWRPAVLGAVSREPSGSGCGDPSGSSLLPGDPSLVMHTNVKLDGDTKMSFMKEMSAAIAETLSKPESYVAVCVMDGLDLIWGGEDTPCALCTITSLGGINPENNATLSKTLCDKIAALGIPPTRYYITFQDIPRPNMGYNGGTF